MNVVDSCGWLEYFANGANADFLPRLLKMKTSCSFHMWWCTK